MKKTIIEMPGIHIQAPWSKMILSGTKTVETRSYPLPKKYKNVRLAIIETPGPFKLAKNTRIVGTVVFSKSFQYKNKRAWLRDQTRHKVSPNDALFGFDSSSQKMGWEIVSVERFKTSFPPPKIRGIIFARSCRVSRC